MAGIKCKKVPALSVLNEQAWGNDMTRGGTAVAVLALLGWHRRCCAGIAWMALPFLSWHCLDGTAIALMAFLGLHWYCLDGTAIALMAFLGLHWHCLDGTAIALMALLGWHRKQARIHVTWGGAWGGDFDPFHHACSQTESAGSLSFFLWHVCLFGHARGGAWGGDFDPYLNACSQTASVGSLSHFLRHFCLFGYPGGGAGAARADPSIPQCSKGHRRNTHVSAVSSADRGRKACTLHHPPHECCAKTGWLGLYKTAVYWNSDAVHRGKGGPLVRWWSVTYPQCSKEEDLAAWSFTPLPCGKEDIKKRKGKKRKGKNR
eukprot:1156718-Pelagomonas_calceolata.AAC.6